MRTPSIERRFVAVGLVVVAVLVIALDLLAYLSVRATANANADRVADAQVAVVKAEGVLLGAQGLADRLRAIGIKAVVVSPDGTQVRTDQADSSTPALAQLSAREVALDRGIRVMLSTPSAASDPRPGRVVVLAALITPLVLALSALLLRWIAQIATKPLVEIAARARRTTGGSQGERLRPDRPDTRLGQMATAYDDMLDSLEGIAAQLDSSLVALAAAAEEARQSEAQTRRFLDDAAHQLRSPITSIRACAETLSLDITPEQRERLLEAVCRESARASRLMAGLLRMARLGREQALELQPTDVLALCEEEADRATLESPELDVTVTPTGRPAGQPRLAAHAVGEILSNLVDNGRRHARSRIEIQVEGREDGVELRVLDDGPGVPEGQAEAVFERFVSLDDKGGSGLGLAIGRELARAHGGDLTYGDGAFVLRLPCEPESIEDGKVRAGMLAGPQAPG